MDTQSVLSRLLHLSQRAGLAWCILGAFAPPALSITIHVPADHPTIQSAIDAAQAGDVVLVAPGVYSGPISFDGKQITVRSASGPGVTTIDGGGAGTPRGSLARRFEHRIHTDGLVEIVDPRQGRRVVDADGRYLESRSSGAQGSVVLFDNGETRLSVLDGFTVTGGDADARASTPDNQGAATASASPLTQNSTRRLR